MKKRILCLALTLVLALGLAAPALAYSTPDFSDLPADNWAYGPVMRMADQGIIQGTGNGMFSPELKVSVAQFLTLVGRIVFPETKINEGDTWFGPYMTAAEKGGLLTGTQVDVSKPEAGITRYDMAVILRGAAKKLGKTETLAQQSQVTDYGVIPNMYTEAVLAVYGMGLIKGDQAGNFNGSNTMQRNELATVIDRLVALKAPGGTTTEPEKPAETQKPADPDDDWEFAFAREYVPDPYNPDEVELQQGTELRIYKDFMKKNAFGSSRVYLRVGDKLQLTVDMVPAGYNYTKDDVQWSSWDENVATVDENGLVTIVGQGQAVIDATIPVIYYGNVWTEQLDRVMIFCEA